MKKRLLFLVVSALLWGGAATVQAEIYSGECGAKGANVTWKLNTETGALEISGTGAMSDREYKEYKEYEDIITSVTITEGVTTIAFGAFSDFKNLTSVTIPASVTTIGSIAFSGCTSLTTITIPDGVGAIDGGTFYGCTSLTSVTIGKGVTSIGEDAFYWCRNLTSITIPDGVTVIGSRAFYNCALGEITLPASVGTIGGEAFRSCSDLGSVVVYNPEPIGIGTGEGEGADFAFNQVDCEEVLLYVPGESVEKYKKAEGWKRFKIRSIEELEVPDTPNPNAPDEPSAVTETQAEAGHIAVYNLQGVPVLETDDAADLKTLQSGAYIVNGKTIIIAR